MESGLEVFKAQFLQNTVRHYIDFSCMGCTIGGVWLKQIMFCLKKEKDLFCTQNSSKSLLRTWLAEFVFFNVVFSVISLGDISWKDLCQKCPFNHCVALQRVQTWGEHNISAKSKPSNKLWHFSFKKKSIFYLRKLYTIFILGPILVTVELQCQLAQ